MPCTSGSPQGVRGVPVLRAACPLNHSGVAVPIRAANKMMRFTSSPGFLLHPPPGGVNPRAIRSLTRYDASDHLDIESSFTESPEGDRLGLVSGPDGGIILTADVAPRPTVF